MQFFPHRESAVSVKQATSASIAMSASLISNFATIPVATASVATNITGSSGAAGDNYTKIGEVGLTGTQGERGVRGDSLYILAVGWSKTTPTTCNSVQVGTYTINTVPDPDEYICDFNTTTTYYIAGGEDIEVGTILYYNSSCTSPVFNLTIPLSYNSGPSPVGAFQTDETGAAVQISVCGVAE